MSAHTAYFLNIIYQVCLNSKVKSILTH